MERREIYFSRDRLILFVSFVLCIGLFEGTICDCFSKPTAAIERMVQMSMPLLPKEACESDQRDMHIQFGALGAPDSYGHVNIVVGRNHKIYYHTVFRSLDLNPCHHLHPNETQLYISEADFRSCEMKDLTSLILTEKNHLKSENDRMIITFSFADGAVYQDLISVLDIMDEAQARIYVWRDLTSREILSIQSLERLN